MKTSTSVATDHAPCSWRGWLAVAALSLLAGCGQRGPLSLPTPGSLPTAMPMPAPAPASARPQTGSPPPIPAPAASANPAP